MAICITKTISQLGETFVLTPERYNPKRRMVIEEGIKLSEIVYLSDELLTVKKGASESQYQINTGDAMGGYLRIPQNKEVLNSNKKILRNGDVIISRLRPYLRQIALVDDSIGNNTLCASTEFYVLRSRNNKSISFLVPYLLSDSVQTVFANAVEGSQHPRFKDEDINNLIIPFSLLDRQDELSEKVENAIRDYRKYESQLTGLISDVNSMMITSEK